jgi:dTDP-4-dehydrorhamnose reductase
MHKLLVIGGGRQIGKALIDSLDESKFEITILNRGITSQLDSEFYKNKNIKYIRGERTEFINNSDLDFDIVIDTCSYDPIQYSRESSKWRKYHGKYILISSAYVYKYDSSWIDESTTLIGEKNSSTELNSAIDEYGIKKIKCERIASETLSDLLILRPGILLSEFDHTFRIEKWITRTQSGFYPSEAQKKWITQILSTDDFVSFIFKCIDDEIKGAVNTAGTPIFLETFWNVILNFKEEIKIEKKIAYSKELEFFEKKSQAIIKTDMAEKYGMIKTNSEKLLIQILEKKCKKY